MKASDLRILNKILFSEDGTVCEVLEIDLNGLRVDCGDGEVVWIEIEQFDGIPITEEWLLKFGFKLIEESHHKFPDTRDTYDKTKIVEWERARRMGKTHKLHAKPKEA